MSDQEILDEIERNAATLQTYSLASSKLTRWDKGVVIAGTLFGVGGLVLTGPLGFSALVLGLGGLAVIGIDLAKKVGDLRGAREVIAKCDALVVRNATLKNVLRRRYPGVQLP